MMYLGGRHGSHLFAQLRLGGLDGCGQVLRPLHGAQFGCGRLPARERESEREVDVEVEVEKERGRERDRGRAAKMVRCRENDGSETIGGVETIFSYIS